MEITNVAFDTNGPTQMYVECGIANPTTPTVLRDWALSISTDNEEKELRPHDVSTGRSGMIHCFRVTYSQRTFPKTPYRPVATGLFVLPLWRMDS
jgi:hypothetical protein